MLRRGIEPLEGRRLLAGLVTQVGYFDTWDGGVIRSTDVAGITYHPSGQLYLADSEINELPLFTGNNVFAMSLAGDQLVREVASGNTEPTGITFNAFDGYFYVTNDTRERLVTRYDNNLDNPLYEFAPQDDVPGAVDPEGIASDPATGRLFVADGHDGGVQILIYSLDTSDPDPATRAVRFEGGFSVADLLDDVEGIAFHSPSGNLFLMDGSQDTVFEYTTTGVLIEEYDINTLVPRPKTPQGLTFAPTSSTTDHPDALALYIADAGRDNFPDGGVYEAIIGDPMNFPPVTSGISDKRIIVGDREVVVDLAAAFLDYEDPDAALSYSVESVSNPFLVAGTAIDAGSGTLAVTAVAGAIGTAEIAVRATDTGDPALSVATTFTLRVDPIDPANQTTIQSRVSVHSDDAEEQLSGRVLVGSSDLELSLDGVTRQLVGIRFADLKIPAGAYIQDAYIQFQADEKDSGETSLTIHAQAIDHAPTFRSTIRNISSRDTTSASAGWSPEAWTTTGQAGADQRTSDLSAVVQEIVDRPGWWSGNAMAFIVTGNGRRVAESFNGISDAAPLLIVEYSTRVSIGGTPSEDQVLTASNSISSDARVGDVTYQWLRDGVGIPGATGPAFVLSQADVGTSITVAAIYRDGQGTLRNVFSADVGPIANRNDDPVGSVTISGAAIQGETLNATNTLTDADGLNAIGYQWRRDGMEIPAATSAAYTLVQADVGRTITVTASYTDGAGTLEAVTSDSTAVVTNVNDAPVGGVDIVNQTPVEHDLLTISNRLTDEDGLGVFSYQWHRDLVDIPGAITSSYSLTQQDVGSVFTVTVSYTDGFGAVESVTSDPTAAVANLNDPPVGQVTISNLAVAEDDLLGVSNTLTDEDGLGTVGYQWKRNDIPIPGATTGSYMLVQEDVGSVITVTASYTDGYGTIESVTSASTAPVVNRNDAPHGGLAIDNLTPAEDDRLTALSTIDDEDGLGVIAYQWMRDGIQIPGAATNSYTLRQADVGSLITVIAVYTDGQGTLESVTSAGTTAVVNVNDVPVGSVWIDKLSPAEDDVLTAFNTLQDEDGLGQIRYQWMRDGVDILGVTGDTYALAQADVGSLITVTASYADGLGTDEAVTSLATEPVRNLNDLPTGIVSIDNVLPTEDDLLTVSHTLDDEDGLGTVSFQWKRDGANIQDANTSSYTVTQADVDSVISVTATYSDRQGTFEAVDSAATAAVQNLNDQPTGGITIDHLTPAEDENLTASSTLADEDGLGAIRYQWKRDNVDIPGATSSSYKVVQSDVDAMISVTASYIDGQGTVESVTSVATAVVINVNDVPTGMVTIDNLTPAEDDELTVANTLADEDGLGTIMYQWHRDGVDVPGAVVSRYLLQQIDVGAVVSVTASYTDGFGIEEKVTVSATAPTSNLNDEPVGNVSISGISSAGQVLTADHTLTDEDGMGTVSYQWKRSSVDIDGAIGTAYTLAADDVGSTITVVASYTDGQGTLQQVSSTSIGPITPNRVPTGHVIITGTPREDQTLTASNTLADEDGLGLISYQWWRDGIDIPGAASDTYTLTQADVGATVTAVARYTDGLGTVEAVTSTATDMVENVNDVPTGGVMIDKMVPAEDDLLTADITLADEDGLGPISFQWLRDGIEILEATEQSYRLTQADVGNTITVTADYTDGQGTMESATSPATAEVQNRNDGPTGTVTINNLAPTEDDVLTVSNTLADEDGLGTVGYQWHRDGVVIPAATASSFTLQQIDVGAVISVTASYIDDYGTEENLSATTSDPVTNVNDEPTGDVSVSGIPSERQVLTAANTLADEDGLGIVGYQWQRSGTDIEGALGPTYSLHAVDIGSTITVVASYTDGHGTSEQVTSAEIGPVVPNQVPAGSVTITGTAREDEMLTSSNSLTDADGLGQINYQWQRDGVAIPDATSDSYTLRQIDVGTVITVVASYTDFLGNDEAVSSAATDMVANINDSPGGGVIIDNLTPTEGDLLSAANTLEDEDGLGTVSYQWQRNDVAIPEATSSRYELTEADVDAVIAVLASYIDDQGTEESVSSAATAAVSNLNDAPTGNVTIDNLTPAEDDVLTVANTLADEDGVGEISYQWKRDGIEIPGATASAYTLMQADVNAIIAVTASYTDRHGTDESVTSTATFAVTNRNDMPSGSVTIDETSPAEDDLLTVANTLADEDGLGTIRYQWQRDGIDIPDATNSSYTVLQSDVGSVITVTASYTDGYGTVESVRSDNNKPVVNVNDQPEGSVTITGLIVEQQTLSASNALSDADGMGEVSYQWQRDGLNLVGQANTTYILTGADIGSTISVVASYTDGFGASEHVASASVGPILANHLPTGNITILGVAAEDQILSVSNMLSDIDGLGEVSYQWIRDGVSIPSEVDTSFTTTQADVESIISVVATYTDNQGTQESVVSAGLGPIANVNDDPTGTVSISGVLSERHTLTVNNALSDEDGLGTMTYQWRRDGVDIPGAVGPSYILTADDVDSVITVMASYTDAGGTEETFISAGVGPIPPNHLPTGSVTIGSLAAGGQTLSAVVELADPDGLGAFSYQWQRDGVDIVGATGRDYRIVRTDVGSQVTINVFYTDGNGNLENVTSNQAEVVTMIELLARHLRDILGEA